MTTQNGTVQGVTLLSGNPNGAYSTVSTVNYGLQSYLVECSFPAYTGSSDTMTVNGILTAINAAVRDGKTRVLVAAVPGGIGLDTNAQGVIATGTSGYPLTVSNGSTTGDVAGNLSDESQTELTAATASSGVGIIAVCTVTPP